MKVRFYRIVLNFFASLSRNAVGLGLGLVATPFILKFLGQEQYGAFRVLMDWTAQLGLLEFGLYTALLPIFSQSLTPSSDYNPRTVFRQAFQKYVFVLIYQLLGFGVIFLFLDELIPVSPDLVKDLHIAGLVFGLSLLFSFSQIFRAYLDASQRGYLLSIAMTLQNITYIGLAAFLAYRGWEITGQALAYGFSLGVSLSLLIYLSLREVRKYEHQPGAQLYFQRSLKAQRAPHFWFNVFGRSSFLVDNLIISALLGAKQVTGFYLSQRLIQIAMQQLQQLGNSTWPAMSELYFKGELQKFRNRTLDVTEFIAFASGALLSVLVLVNPSFVRLWTGPDTFVSFTLVNLVILNAGLFALTSFWLWLFTGSGLISKTLPLLGTQALVNLGLSYFATLKMGIIGPALGTFVGLFCVAIPWTIYLIHKEFGVSILLLTRAWVLPFLIPTSLTIGATYITGPMHLLSWWSLIAASVVFSLVTLGTFPWLFVRRSTRTKTYLRVKELIQKKFRV